MTDDMLRAMTNNGGVVMVNSIPPLSMRTTARPLITKVKQRDAGGGLRKRILIPTGARSYDEMSIEKKWAAVPAPAAKSLIDQSITSPKLPALTT